MPPIGHTMLWSVLRTERTGPTLSGACELKIAARRVMPPSTTSSYTTSAWSTPVLRLRRVRVVDLHRDGRALRAPAPFGSGRPVSGATGTTFGFVVVVGRDAVLRGLLARRRRTRPRSRRARRQHDERPRAHTLLLGETCHQEIMPFTSPATRGCGRRAAGGCRTDGSTGRALVVLVERLLDPEVRGRLRRGVDRRRVVLAASRARRSGPAGTA